MIKEINLLLCDTYPGLLPESIPIHESMFYNLFRPINSDLTFDICRVMDGELPFHLIADTDLTILKAYEAWGEKKMYGKVTEGTLRTTYVIDKQGVIVDAIGKVNTKDHTTQILR